MRKILIIVILVIFFVAGCNSVRFSVNADELEDINKKLTELTTFLKSSEQATATNEKQLTTLTAQLESIKAQVVKIEKDIDQKEQDIKAGEEKLIAQKKLLDERVASFYKQKGKTQDAILQILVSDNLTTFLKQFRYQQNLLNNDRRTIVRVVLLVKDIEEKKIKLEDEKVRLIPIKEQIAKQSLFLEGEVLSAKKYEQTLKSEIASLTAQQQAVIAQKQAGLNLPRSAGLSTGGCIDDRNIDPGFSPGYAFYTYGSVHRVGMNQFGAYGRSRAGQNYETILNAYYNNIRLECRNFPNNNIRVQGYGEKPIYEYLKGIGEMPNTWGDSGGYEALKAQVVAAASFAYAYTDGGGGEICTNQNCQVYLGNNKGGKWEETVNEIKNFCGDGVQVMVSNDTGEVVKAWYASTHGGYAWTSGEIWGSNKPWTKHFQDTSTNAGSFSELNERAWDKDSPWFYCDWGARSQYNKTAWLKSEELADIVNTILLAKVDSSTREHLYQPDNPPAGTDNWGPDKVKQELRSRGQSPFNSISDGSVSADFSSGRVSSVNFSGDAGNISFSLTEFKDWFNLRAPANIQIVGPLFNIEKRQ